ncbi:L,D-transpeptidase [Aerosakkonemataceae cyanobacterium BLCC-F50]|uniref:L,D-transpeptidase n=1 Tax=Floridaenema flaviceps BLCC-F50 TaxID=3153642 RepID=A0ABV4XL18_9CYAN
MKKMVRGEALTKSFLLICFSTTFFSFGSQQQATASIFRNKGVELTKSQPIPESHTVPTTPLPSQTPGTVQPSPVSPVEDTWLKIKLQERRVYVYRDNQVKTSFPVAIGKPGWETPTGKFQIIQMVKDPAWQHPWNGKVFPPGPNNPLGVRWIGFWTDGKNTIGFHGTPNERVMGQAVSHGCVRMRNRDVVALFELVQVGTTVVVEH